MNKYNSNNKMREPLKLNNHPVNQHAKFLLTRIDPKDDLEGMYRLPNLNYVPIQISNEQPSIYFLSLMQWVLDEQRLEGIFGGNQQMLLEQVWELTKMPPQEAWKWLNLGRKHEAFQMTEDPIEGAEIAVKILLKQIAREQQEIYGPSWEVGPRRMTDDDLIDWIEITQLQKGDYETY